MNLFLTPIVKHHVSNLYVTSGNIRRFHSKRLQYKVELSTNYGFSSDFDTVPFVTHWALNPKKASDDLHKLLISARLLFEWNLIINFTGLQARARLSSAFTPDNYAAGLISRFTATVKQNGVKRSVSCCSRPSVRNGFMGVGNSCLQLGYLFLLLHLFHELGKYFCC